MQNNEVIASFESLGDNCEFGLLQRQVGIEPLGLLRFAGFHIPIENRLAALTQAILSGFEGLGQPANIELQKTDTGEVAIYERRYNLFYHTFRQETEVNKDKIIDEQCQYLGYLRSRFIADIERPSKIFVWRSLATTPMRDMFTLVDALRQRSLVRLLWVKQATPQLRPGSVEILADGFYRGTLERLAPYENAGDIDVAAWVDLCREVVSLEVEIGRGRLEVTS